MASRPRDIDSRIQALEAQLADDPASPAFFPLAGLTWEKGEADKAIDLLTSGLQHHTAYTAPRVLLGEIYLAKEQIGEAASELEKAIARAPWNLAAQRFLMDCHKKSGDEGGVRRALVAIGMFDPGDSAAALDEGGDVPAAGPSAPVPPRDEAWINEAGDAVPTESLAELYVSQGHIEKALGVYQILAEEDPENTGYLEKISDLREQLDAGGGEAAPGIEGGADEFPESEDFDSILAEAGGVDEGAAEAPELEAPVPEDFDSILDEAAPVVEAPAARADDAEAGGEVDDLDALFADESVEPAAPVPAAEAAGEGDDLDALFADESVEPAAPAPAAEAAGEGDDLDALFTDESDEPAAPAPAAEAAGEVDDLDALFTDESDEPAAPVAAADEPEDLDALGEPPGEIAGEPEEVKAGTEMEAEAAGADAGAELEADAAGGEEAVADDLNEFAALLAEEPALEGPDDLAALGEPPGESAGADAVAELEADVAGVEEAVADDLNEFDALLADEPALEGPDDLAALGEPPAESAGADAVAELEADVTGVEEAVADDLNEFDALLAEEPALEGPDDLAALGEPSGEPDEAEAEEPIAAGISEEAVPVDGPDGEEEIALVEPAPAGDGAGEGDDLDALFAEELVDIETGAAAEKPEDVGTELEAEAGGSDVYLESVVFEEEDEPRAKAPEVSTPGALPAEAPLAEESAPEVVSETEPVDLPEAAEAAQEDTGAVLAAEAAQEDTGAVLAENMTAMEESAPEPVLNEAESMMSGIVDMYINEGNAPLALDLCRKALTAGQGAAWLEVKIQELEARVAEGGEGDLPRPAGEVMEDVEPSYSGPHSDVVKSLESWLRTIQRRKARISPGPQGGPGGGAD